MGAVCSGAHRDSHHQGGLLHSGKNARLRDLVHSDAPLPVVHCLQYHRLFIDAASGSIYLEYWADNWMQLFQLVPGAGQLPIVAGPPPS
jgi:hypothetical protein